MRKLEMVSGLLQEISFVAITWNPESNCTCREKNHFPFRWSASTLPEPLIRHWMYCWRRTSEIHALLCTGRSKINPAKKTKKDGDKKCSGYTESCTTVGLRISGHRAARIFIDFTEEHKSLGTNSTSTFHRNYAASCKHPRKFKSKFLISAVRTLWNLGNDGRIWNPCSQCDGSVDANERWKVYIPSEIGTVKLSGGDQDLRTSTLIRDCPDRVEEQDNLRGVSEGSSWTSRQDSSWYDGEAGNDFWSISGDFIYRHHVEPRVKLYVPTEESFPIPMKYIDVARTTHTSLDVLLEKNVDDYWNADGERELSDEWKGFTRFILLNERPPGFSWSGRRLTRKRTTSTPDNVWPDMGSICLMQRNAKQNKNGLSRNPRSTMPDNWEEYSSLNQTTENSSSQWKMLVESWEFRCQQQCLVKTKQIAAGKPAAVLGNTRTNMLVLLKLTSLWEFVWKAYRKGIMKIKLLQKE